MNGYLCTKIVHCQMSIVHCPLSIDNCPSALYPTFRACTGVTTDSRRCPAGSMFFALRGEHFDGNAFAARALSAGCAYAVVDRPEVIPAGDGRYLPVDDVLHALQGLARLHRRTLGLPVLAITGTNGKTTTKELVAAVLARRYRVLHTEGNLNNAIGVPLTLLRLRPEHELAVIEMGASHPGDIRELTDIAEPDMGLITNVGRAHLQGFGSIEGVARTKGELFDFLRRHGRGPAFVCLDDERVRALASGLRQVGYGREQAPADGRSAESGHALTGRVLSCSPFLTFCWQNPEEAGATYEVRTHLIGDYNLPNVLAAIAVGIRMGVPPTAINAAIEGYIPGNNRSQLLQTARNTLIIDAYNANPTSMQASLGNFLRMDAPAKTVILGDMRELGEVTAREHQRVVDRLEQADPGPDVFLVGPDFSATRHHGLAFPDAPALCAYLRAHPLRGRTILLKGSNSLRLNTVVDYL